MYVVTYRLSLNYLNRIKKVYSNILYISREAMKVFSPGLMILFKSACKISSHFVRAKIYSLERTVDTKSIYYNVKFVKKEK